MDKLEILFAKALLQEHARERMCPGKTNGDKELLKKHFSMCPLCEDWHEVFGELLEEEKEIVQGKIPVKPGQIWKISSKLSGWVDDASKYFNAPLVAVLSVRDPIARVALVHDKEFFSLGTQSIKGFYIETWNAFSIPVEYLEVFITDLEQCLEESYEIPQPKDPIEENFIKTEMEVSSYFALKVLDEVTQLVGAQDVLNFIEWESDEEFFPFLTAEESGRSILERLATLVPPDSMLPLAAASSDVSEKDETILVKIVDFKESKPSFRISVGYITFRNRIDEKLILGGHISEPLSKDAGIYAALVDGITNNVIMSAEEAFINHENGFFRIVFSGLSERDEKRSRLAIVIGTR